MRKAILLLLLLTFWSYELAYAEGKTFEFAASCYVPERLELASTNIIDTSNLKESAELASQNTASETQLIQKEEIIPGNPDEPATVVYTIIAR